MIKLIYRKYCSVCQSFEDFVKTDPQCVPNVFICNKCDTPYNPIEIKDIDFNLVHNELNRKLTTFDEDADEYTITHKVPFTFFPILEKLTERQNRDFLDAYNEEQRKLIPFKQTSRNQFCPCGSGKKYKKCCLLKIRYYSVFAVVGKIGGVIPIDLKVIAYTSDESIEIGQSILNNFYQTKLY